MKLFKTQFGSQVYGIATPNSDIDIGVVIMESPSHIYGLQNAINFPQVKDNENHDIRKFWLKRFLSLCVRGNPNALEWLYTQKDKIISCEKVFQEQIINNRELFLDGSSLIHSHMGFALSQIVKMRRHEQEMGAKRRALYNKYGYDVKYASHAVRLIHQLTSIMKHGTMVLPYEEEVRAELLAIKVGEVSVTEFNKLYEDKVIRIEKLIEDEGDKFKAKYQPDYAIISDIMTDLYYEVWGIGN